MGDPQITDRFTCHVAAIEHLDPGTHLIQNFKNSSSRWIQPHVFDGEVCFRDQGSSNQPECC